MSTVIDGIVTGDDVDIPVTLTKGSAKTTFTINPVAAVKAAIVSLNRATKIIDTVTCLEAATGADWANSLVIVSFTSTETAAATAIGEAYLEIQVEDGGKLTWFGKVDIIKGSVA